MKKAQVLTRQGFLDRSELCDELFASGTELVLLVTVYRDLRGNPNAQTLPLGERVHFTCPGDLASPVAKVQ